MPGPMLLVIKERVYLYDIFVHTCGCLSILLSSKIIGGHCNKNDGIVIIVNLLL